MRQGNQAMVAGLVMLIVTAVALTGLYQGYQARKESRQALESVLRLEQRIEAAEARLEGLQIEVQRQESNLQAESRIREELRAQLAELKEYLRALEERLEAWKQRAPQLG